jgi:hypothetical protein
MNLERLPEDHHDEAVKFLASVFPQAAGAPFLERKLRHWAYYAPHPFAPQSRSFVFRDAEGLIAHGGVCPVQFVTPGGVKTSFKVIDWASSPRVAGAGFLLFRALWPTADSYLSIGGSDDSRKVLGRIPSMHKVQQMAHFAYPLRPLRQMMASEWTWKSAPKGLRSSRWKRARKRLDLSAWKAVPVERFGEGDAPLMTPAAGGAYHPVRRTPELLNYWLACPAGRMRAWRLEYEGRPVGFAAIIFLRKIARIVDLVVDTVEAPLAEAYSLAIDLAAEEREAYEIAGASSAPPVIEAMGAAGMIARGASDVFFGDPHKCFPNPPIEANLTIGDGFYQQDWKVYFRTF